MTLPLAHRALWTVRRVSNVVRLLCVVALALASVVHVVNDLPSARERLSHAIVADSHGNQGTDSAKMAGETCHSCSVVSFLDGASAASFPADVAVVPKGRSAALSAFTNPLTVPPPRA